MRYTAKANPNTNQVHVRTPLIVVAGIALKGQIVLISRIAPSEVVV